MVWRNGASRRSTLHGLVPPSAARHVDDCEARYRHGWRD